MNINKFEEQIKSAFERHRPKADNDAIWRNIEPRLKKKKKRRFIIFFWMLGLGLLLFFWKTGRESFPSAYTSLSTGKNTSALPLENETHDKEAEIASQEKLSTEPVGNVAQSNAQNASAEKYSATSPDAEALSANKNTSTKFAETAENTTQGQGATKNVNTETKGKDVESAVVGEPKADAESAVQEAKGVSRDSVPKTSVLEKPARAEVERSPKDEKVDKNAQDEKKPNSRKKSKKRKFNLEQNLGIQAGPALAIRQLKDRSGGLSAPAGLLEGRRATEHSMESYTVGIFYSAVTHKGLVLKTGVDYRQANEKFHLAINKKETEQKTGVLTLTLNSAGDTIAQTIGSKTVTKTTEYSNTVYNHYRFVNLPVGLGYQHTGEKSRWELSGGLDFNLLFRADGAIYNSNNVPTSFKYGTTSYENTFRHRTGMGLWAAYSYSRKLTDKLYWSISANTQIPLRPVSSPNYALVQRYFNFGVQAGVAYQMKKGKKGK